MSVEPDVRISEVSPGCQLRPQSSRQLAAVAQSLDRGDDDTLATFMEVLDSSIANVSLPHIAGSLGATYEEATWVPDQLSGFERYRTADFGLVSTLIGRKRFYMSMRGAIHRLLVSLRNCAPLPLLIFSRVLQGAGGGGLQPSEQAILADTFPAGSAAWRLRCTAWQWL